MSKSFHKFIQTGYNKLLIISTVLFLLTYIFNNYFIINHVYCNRIVSSLINPFLGISIFLFLFKLRSFFANKILKFLTKLSAVLIGVLIIFDILACSVRVHESSIDNKKYLFYSNEYYNYYVLDKRRSAPDDHCLIMYKTHQVNSIISYRVYVNNEEIEKNGINYMELIKEYSEYLHERYK